MMSKLVLISPADENIIITSVEAWRRLAPPKRGDRQWKDGRSAKELAKAWFRQGGGVPTVPEEFEQLLQSHPMTRGLVIEKGYPERTTKLDGFTGGQRNHDLVLIGSRDSVRTVVCIEAKADEPFGDTVGQRLARYQAKTRSNVPKRICSLCKALFAGDVTEEISGLRYQLVHAVAGTLIEARAKRASLALFVIHEFLVEGCFKSSNVQRNARDFKRFVRMFPKLKGEQVEPGSLAGPIKIPGGEDVRGDLPLLIGKITTRPGRRG